jgi:hypothetical protein
LRAPADSVFVVGKNYRLQDIQLSKMRRSFPAVSVRLPAFVERRVRGELLSIYDAGLAAGVPSALQPKRGAGSEPKWRIPGSNR